MLISHNGYDVTPFIIAGDETDNEWYIKISDMFRFIRNIPEYNELLNKYLFDKGLTILIYVTNGELEDFLPSLLDGQSNQNSNRTNQLGFCVDGAPIIVIDLLTIYRDHSECEKYMPKGVPYITIDELVFDVLCHEITHLFQNQKLYSQNNESQYMETECEDFMYTVIFNNFDKTPNPYITKDGYLYNLYKKKLKKYVTDFEYPSVNILNHTLVYQLFVSCDDIAVKYDDKYITLFSNYTSGRTSLGISLLMSLIVMGDDEASMYSKIINNKNTFVYELFDIDHDLIKDIFGFVYNGLGYSATESMLKSFKANIE